MNNTFNWDAIFIGAGISSLACASMLLKNKPDLKLLLIDKHIVPGGYASNFTREKVNALFDCSLHKLSGISFKGNLRRILDGLDLNKHIEYISSPIFFRVYGTDQILSFSNDIKLFKEELYNNFPLEKNGIDKFFLDVEKHGKNSYYQFQIQDGSFLPDINDLRYAHRNLKDKTVKVMLDNLFNNEIIKEVLSALSIYVGGFPEELSYLYYLHVIYATLYMGNAYVKGSAQALSDALASIIQENKGSILLGTKVKKILIENNQVLGVKTNRGSFYSKRVYINTSPHYAIENFIDKNINLTYQNEKLKNLKPANSTTTLYLVLDQPPADLGILSSESMILSENFSESVRLREASNNVMSLCENAFWINSTMEVTNYHLLDKNGGMTICLNLLDSIHHWPKRKSMPYREKKERATSIMLARFLKYFPDVEEHIIYKEMATPRTYLKFTNNTEGSGYGALVKPDLTGHTFHYNFPIKGIDFLSAWVAGPSYEAAFDYAEMKAKQWDG